MSTLFALLFLVALGFLVWGIISPASLSRVGKKPVTRKDAVLGFGVVALVFAILTGVTAPKASQTEATTTKPAATEALDAPAAKAVKRVPVVTTQTTSETEVIPFTSTTVTSAALAKGTTKITTPGVNGIKTSTYVVTYTDGAQTDKKLVKEAVTTAPIIQVTTVGTYVKLQPAPTVNTSPTPSNCDPSYTGACVPNVYPSDVDCGGGSGNGPYYVYGTVHVVGIDRYDLDRDGDGYGCE